MTDPTPAEVNRRLDLILEMLHRIEDRMTPRGEFEAHRQETSRRLLALEETKSAAHDAIHAKIAAVQTDLRAEIEKVESEGDRREEARQKSYRDINTRAWVAIGGAILAVVGGVISSALGT